jgi:hypothetical protein
MLRRSMLTALLLSTIFVGNVASADIIAPVGDGNGAPAPGKTSNPPIPPRTEPRPGPKDPPAQTPPGSDKVPAHDSPKGRPSNPRHPDPNVGNRPPPGWYDDMYDQIYNTSYYFSQVEEWAYHEYSRTGYSEVYNVYIYASYMRYTMTAYFWNYFEYDSSQKIQPRYFPEWGGNATRGDFNYNYYYYVRPIYREFLRYSGEYYRGRSHENDYNHDYGYGRYTEKSEHSYSQYHSFSRCNNGKNGADPLAQDDTEVLAEEIAAGISKP